MLKDIDKNACKCTIEKEINSLKQLEVLLGDSVLSNVLDLLQNGHSSFPQINTLFM